MARPIWKDVSYPLHKLIADIDVGEIGLPDIQRPFVWPNAKVRDLFDSMYRGYPVGHFLFWIGTQEGGTRAIGAGGHRPPRLLIVDGQQRLTSLYAVLKGVPVLRENFRRERIQIAFRPRDCRFEVADSATRRDPEFIPDIGALWAGGVSLNGFGKAFLRRLRDTRPVEEREEDVLLEAIGNLYGLHTYPFAVVELGAEFDEEQVAEVFVRINSQGKTLNQADFILTLMSVFWDEGRTELEAFCAESRRPGAGGATAYNPFIHPAPDQMLRASIAVGFNRARLKNAYSLLRGKDMSTGAFDPKGREERFKKELKPAQAAVLDRQNWADFLNVLRRAGYRGGAMISSELAIVYAYALFLIGKRRFRVEPRRLRAVMARWFFMITLTSRYTGSFETTFEADLGRLRDVADADGFAELLDRLVTGALTDDYWSITLPEELATSAARSPSLFGYYAALNLLDARALFSDIRVADLLDPTGRGDRAPTERHHLFPRAHLDRRGIADIRDVNQIANYALVEWRDNTAISDKAPHVYWRDYAARLDPPERARMAYWHALPEGWTEMDYREFLRDRRLAMAGVIRDAFRTLGNRAPEASDEERRVGATAER